jgi:hypothetical protein
MWVGVNAMLTHLEAAAAQELERTLKLRVTQEFEAALQSGACEAPITGDTFYPDSQRAKMEKRAVMALMARKWFAENEAPPWAGELPLTPDECIARFNGPNRGSRRGILVGEYGQLLRSMGWNLQHVPPFEVFCSQVLSPAS